MVLLLYLFVLFLVAGTYVYVATDPGRQRKRAVAQLGRLLYGVTVASIIGGVALFIGVLWFAVGATVMFVFDSDRLAPSGSTKRTLRDLIMWPYDHIAWGITRSGSKPALGPPL